MDATAKLTELMDSMEMQSEEWIYRYDRKAGATAMVERAVYAKVEDSPDEELDLDDESVPLARAMIANEGSQFIALPDTFELHEYRQMERFIGTVEDARVAEELWRAIKGKGAFRNFKDTAARCGLLDSWYRFRDERAKQFVIRWAEANEVPYEDDTARRGK